MRCAKGIQPPLQDFEELLWIGVCRAHRLESKALYYRERIFDPMPKLHIQQMLTLVAGPEVQQSSPKRYGTDQYQPVGFDRLFNLLETGNVADGEGYPPFDIVKDAEISYRITLAVAGFRHDEIDIVAQQKQLSVSGKKADEGQDTQYIHRGIATRSFERPFQLADFVEVRSANFQDGLLSISLQRVVPEAMKPRKIEIGAGEAEPNQIGSRQPEAANASAKSPRRLKPAGALGCLRGQREH